MPIELSKDLKIKGFDEAFLENIEKFRQTLQTYGYKIQKDSESALRHYLSLPEEKRQNVTRSFSLYSDIIYSAVEKGVDLKDDRSLLRHTSQKLGLVFSEDTYINQEDGEIIEIYNAEFIQVYRNLALFDICGYGIMDLLANEFYELYERSESINEGLMKACLELSTRRYNLAPLPLSHIRRHLMREKFSVEKVTSSIDFKRIYPVYQWPQEFYGYITVQRATPVFEVPENVSFI